MAECVCAPAGETFGERLDLDPYRSVVITGGGGMLAQELAALLRARGVEPVALRRSECDISDQTQVKNLFRRINPSLVLNCAAHTKVDLCEDQPELAHAINSIGVGYLGQESVAHGSKLVNFSTDFVFDGQSDRPYRPDDVTNPLSVYGKSKLGGEKRLVQFPVTSWLNIRTAWLFGRHGSCFPRIIADRARAGHSLCVVNDQIGCATYAADLAQATLELLDRQVSGTWHITNTSPTNWYEFANAVLSEFGISGTLTPIATSDWVAQRPRQARRPAYSVLDGQPYASLTGLQMRGWREALRDYRTAVEKGS